MEAYTPVNGSAGNSAPVGGRRRKLKLVTKKAARKALKKLGLKFRGGADPTVVPDAANPTAVEATKGGADAVAPVTTEGGRRRRHTKKTRRGRRKSLFGLKY
jgi:hypothetical protein